MAEQNERPLTALESFRRRKDRQFALDPHSPLTPQQRAVFKGLNYFPENPALRLEVDVQVFEAGGEIEMPTTTGDAQTYRRYGRFTFDVDGQPAALTIYYGEYGFFLPFVDALAGVETYSSGRYLEPEPLAGSGLFLVDFNAAYNPYCAYQEPLWLNPDAVVRWSCPITPADNRLSVPIRAGEKLYYPETPGGSAPHG